MLELKQITFSADQKTILHQVDLVVPDGQLLAITGPNGGGKSTLARIIAGIEQPDSGQIIWNGQDITNLNITERAKLGLGYAFQQPVRFKGISVFELLKLASGGDLTIAQACDYLSQVGLCAREYVDRMVDASLSGGELKRIEEGRRLTGTPQTTAGTPITATTALMRFYAGLSERMDICSEVREIEIAYTLSNALGGPISLIPVWHITTDTEIYELNTLDGSLAAAGAEETERTEQ